MIVEQHYDEEVIITLLEEAEQAAARDSHVPSCSSCADTLDSFRTLTSSLHDRSVWDERELSEKLAPQTSAMLRSFAASKAAEDAAAGPIVAKLLAASAEERAALLDRNPGWRTAGVVRKVLARVDETNYTDPKLAAELASFAVEIAESLNASHYPLDTVMKLRATVWRERAYALHYIGCYSEAVQALDRTDELLEKCVVSEFDSARAQLIRSQVYGEIERLDEALALARSAREVFRRFGDVRREAFAESTRAALLMYGRRFTEALRVHLRIAADTRIDRPMRARALHNAAISHRELSQIEEAKSLFTQAIAELEGAGLPSVRARARWNLASVLMMEQRYDQALVLFTQLRDEFAELGMSQDVALVSVDAGEALLMLERPTEVVQFCQAAMQYFTKAGIAYTQGALTALAYLREAANARTLTPTALRDVRAFFEVLPKQPNLLFARLG